jgi:hypothetical protein
MAEINDQQLLYDFQSPNKTNLVAQSEDISLREKRPGREVADYFDAAQW